MKKQLLIATLLVFAAFTLPRLAQATFILDPNPSIDPATFLFLDSAHGATSLTGHVGSQTGPLVNIAANDQVNVVGSGFATIQDVHGTLSSLVFTPGDATKYGDFSFRGQLSSAGNVMLTIVDQVGAVFTFDITDILAHQDFPRIGVISNDGEWLTSATISTNEYFNQVKQIEFSLQEAAAVPEPGTIMLIGAGFLGLAIYGKRRKNA